MRKDTGKERRERERERERKGKESGAQMEMVIGREKRFYCLISFNRIMS